MSTNQLPPTPDEVKKVIWVAVKEKARQVIGSPPPTKVRRGRKADGRQRAGVTGGLNIYEPEVDETIPDLPHLATNPALHGGMVTSIPSRYLKDVRQKHHAKETLFHFSTAAIAHADYLLKSQGKEAMDKYLAQIKESNDMTDQNQQIATDVHRKREENEHRIGSGLEAEIQRMKARAKHCREQMEVHEKEADSLDAAVLKLEDAMGLLDGKNAKRTYTSAGSRAPHGEWDRRWEEHAAAPITMHSLREKIANLYQVKLTSAYQAINKGIEKGKLKRVDGGMLQYVSDDGK
jgi:hypothetical protein